MAQSSSDDGALLEGGTVPTAAIGSIVGGRLTGIVKGVVEIAGGVGLLVGVGVAGSPGLECLPRGIALNLMVALNRHVGNLCSSTQSSSCQHAYAVVKLSSSKAC